jgi:hypothetical protein
MKKTKKIALQNGSGGIKSWLKRIFKRKPKTEYKLQSIQGPNEPTVVNVTDQPPRKTGHKPSNRKQDEITDTSVPLSIKRKLYRKSKLRNKEKRLPLIARNRPNEPNYQPPNNLMLTQPYQPSKRRVTWRNEISEDKGTLHNIRHYQKYPHFNNEVNHSIVNDPHSHFIGEEPQNNLQFNQTIKRNSNSNSNSTSTSTSTSTSGIRSAFGQVKQYFGKKLTRKTKHNNNKKETDEEILEHQINFINYNFNNNEETYMVMLSDIYEYYIEIKLLPKLDNKIKFVKLLLQKRNGLVIVPQIQQILNNDRQEKIFIKFLLSKFEVIDKIIEKCLYGDSLCDIISKLLNKTDEKFIRETAKKIKEQINNPNNPMYANIENTEPLLPFLENHNEFKNAMLTYYSCLKNHNNQPCTLEITKEQQKSYVTKLQEYIQNPDKIIKAYEEYQPLRRTQEEQALIDGYMELLGKPQFDSSTNVANTL